MKKLNLIVLNGSPKGNMSITIHYVYYIQKFFPQHEFNIVNIGKEIKQIEKDMKYFDTIMEQIKEADGIIWAYPVYYNLVPSQLKYFIEMIWQYNKKDVFKNKYTTSISTSAHFYDHTAQNYIHAISEDLSMYYVNGFPAEMKDLLKNEMRKNLIGFFEYFLNHIENNLFVERVFAPIVWNQREYSPKNIKNVEKSEKKKITIITDVGEDSDNLRNMIDVFQKFMPNPVNIINLNKLNIRGGCLGCMHCGFNGECFYNDDFNEFINKNSGDSDIIIMAGTIKDRYLSATIKQFYDRNFTNGHRPLLKGKYLGYIISGPLRQIPNLRQILEALAQISLSSYLGMVTDEYEDELMITSQIKHFVEKIILRSKSEWNYPPNFLGVGGRKIFRDLVYQNKGIMRADHKFYKKNGLYDYPQKRKKERIFNFLLSIILKSKKARKKISGKKMVEPLKKIVERVSGIT